ncbi:hypothetical protein [Streptomyces sp. WAC01280]|uniref:hypothetical protein n=1 Tax=Streptomyces sp. WAC01280 TaxID=2487424 RepID=UPI000F79F1BE|nr:hypothetical protein [Streptomyces sp. WAC01280]RSS53310.1 hypothetical protein EF909_27875 [Streptomyces sp. WAC01280]
MLDRLSLDVAALHATDSALHLGGLVTLEGEPPSRRLLLKHLRGRIAPLLLLGNRVAVADLRIRRPLGFGGVPASGASRGARLWWGHGERARPGG